MEFIELKIHGVVEIILSPFSDDRGFFMRTFDSDLFEKNGIPVKWVQENHSRNLRKNTLRGLHFCLKPHTDGKLIRCIRGSVYDVHVDLRKDSPDFGKWDSVKLREKDHKWLYLPRGFAHGFCTLSDNTELLYKNDSFYNKGYDSGIIWNDKDLKISWPVDDPVISGKDNKLMHFHEFVKNVGGL